MSPTPLLPYIGDDEKLQLARGFAVINGHETASPSGAIADLCLRYFEHRMQGDSHGRALWRLNALLQTWYPDSPAPYLPEMIEPEVEAPPPAQTSNTPHPALADRKIFEPLRTDGDSFFSGTRTCLPVFCHAGDFIGQWTTLPERRPFLRAQLDAIFVAGYAGLRSWINVNPNEWWISNGVATHWSPLFTSGFTDAYQELVRELNARQLRLHLAPGGLDNMPTSDRPRLFAWIADRIRESRDTYALIEGCNEARDTSAGMMPHEVERLVKPLVDEFGVLGALSAYTGTEDRETIAAWTPEWMRFFLYHSYRGGTIVDKIRHHFSIVREDRVRRIGWSGEPTGPGAANPTRPRFRVSATDHPVELNASSNNVGLLHMQTALCRQVPCFMSSPGVILDLDVDFDDYVGFTTVPTAVSRLPVDVHRFALTHGGAGDAWVSAIGDGQSMVRVDQAYNHDGRFAAMIYTEVSGRAYMLPSKRRLAGAFFDGEGRQIGETTGGAMLSVPAFDTGTLFVGQAV